MFGIVILAMLSLLGGAFALRAGRVFLQRSADRAADARAAAHEAATAAAAGQATTDARHRAHPDWLITLQSTLLRTRIHPLEQQRSQLMTKRDEVKAALDAQPTGPSLVRKLLGYAALLLLPLLCLLSMYQLIPSFYTLSGNAPLALVGGVLVAAIEMGVAFALARVLYQPRREQAAGGEADSMGKADSSLAGRLLAMADSRPGWSKTALAGVMTLTAAGLLVWGQYTWAPAHDLIPLQGQLTVADQTYAQDQENGAPQSLLTSDRLNIDTISTRLAEVRGRDEALALLVPLGEDAVALTALGSLGFGVDDLRRLRRRRQLAGLNQRIGTLDVQIEQVRDAITLELQRRLADVGVNPAIVTQATPPAIEGGSAPTGRQTGHGPAADPTQPGLHHPGPAAAAPETPSEAPRWDAPQQAPLPPGTPGARPPARVEDLFPATPEPRAEEEDVEADRDRRWSDPI